MRLRILSLLLVFLLVMSFAAPAVSADSIDPFERPNHVFLAAPVMVKLAFDGITLLVTSAVLAEIGMHLGKTLNVFGETAEHHTQRVDFGKNGLSKPLVMIPMKYRICIIRYVQNQK